jgi:hypothetical protein
MDLQQETTVFTSPGFRPDVLREFGGSVVETDSATSRPQLHF